MSNLECVGSLITGEERAFLEFLVNENPVKGDIVEIGTYSGDGSTSIFLEHIERTGGQLFALDLYLIDGLLDKVQAMFEGRNAETVQGYSAKLGMDWKTSVDFLFIDGDHGYPRLLPNGHESGVALDVINWHPHLKSGGILAFHDYTGSATTFGQSKYLPIEYAVDGLLWQPGYESLGREGRIVAFRKKEPHTLYFRHHPKKVPADYLEAWQRLGSLERATEVVVFGAGPSAARVRGYAECVWGDSRGVSIIDPANGVLSGDHVYLIAGSPSEEEAAMQQLEAAGLKRHHDFMTFMDFCGWFHLGRLGYRT